jgi:hypothetical protein
MTKAVKERTAQMCQQAQDLYRKFDDFVHWYVALPKVEKERLAMVRYSKTISVYRSKDQLPSMRKVIEIMEAADFAKISISVTINK